MDMKVRHFKLNKSFVAFIENNGFKSITDYGDIIYYRNKNNIQVKLDYNQDMISILGPTGYNLYKGRTITNYKFNNIIEDYADKN